MSKQQKKKQVNVPKVDTYTPQILRLSAGLAGIGMTEHTAEAILEILKAMRKHGDQFSLRHAVDIEYYMERKYKGDRMKVETRNMHAKENQLLREGLRIGVDMVRELKNSSKLKFNPKTKGLMEDYVNSADQLLANQK